MGTTFVDIRRVPMRQEADLLPDRRLGGGWRRNTDVSQFRAFSLFVPAFRRPPHAFLLFRSSTRP